MSRALLIASLMIPLAATLPLSGCLPMPKPVPTGAQDYADFCAGCHGASGKGDGPMTDTLPGKPADLTQLAAASEGAFPMTRVMSKIWGYTRAPDGTVMPRFAPLLETDSMVLFDGGDGISTPTPLRLVQLAEYLRSLQAR